MIPDISKHQKGDMGPRLAEDGASYSSSVGQVGYLVICNCSVKYQKDVMHCHMILLYIGRDV